VIIGRVWASVQLRRLGYRTAYVGLRCWWWLTNPDLNGAKCVITDGDLVLMVRHSYGARVWDFPGGKVERGEDPAATAAREMTEELGLRGVEWHLLGRIDEDVDNRHDTLHCFHGEVHSPSLVLDLGELERAEWFPRVATPADIAPHAAQMLAMLERDGAVR
jgi:8-oxo-dGTP pyrophosphatase MutT (NUDIX family)